MNLILSIMSQFHWLQLVVFYPTMSDQLQVAQLTPQQLISLTNLEEVIEQILQRTTIILQLKRRIIHQLVNQLEGRNYKLMLKVTKKINSRKRKAAYAQKTHPQT
jgi:uncharacterized protein YqcC (DUF446 family)